MGKRECLHGDIAHARERENRPKAWRKWCFEDDALCPSLTEPVFLDKGWFLNKLGSCVRMCAARILSAQTGVSFFTARLQICLIIFFLEWFVSLATFGGMFASWLGRAYWASVDIWAPLPWTWKEGLIGGGTGKREGDPNEWLIRLKVGPFRASRELGTARRWNIANEQNEMANFFFFFCGPRRKMSNFFLSLVYFIWVADS